MKVLFDTNVVLDVILKQEPFYKDSAVVMQVIEKGEISAFLATVSMTNIFYILGKRKKTSVEIYQILDKLTVLFKLAEISQTTVADALALRWKDFEDAVQYVTAKENNVNFIITRNKADYKSSDISCMTPTEFIAFLKEKEELK